METCKVLAELRLRIDEAGVSRYRIARRAGLADCVVSRFVKGRTVSVATLERLASALGVRLTFVPHRPRQRRDRRAVAELTVATVKGGPCKSP